MSWVVEDWVWRNCTVEDDLQRTVLLAIAWHAGDDGTTSGGPSLDTLAEMVRRDRKTVMAAITALEVADELVVWRTVVTARTRRPSNRYAVAMGRRPDDVRLHVEERRHRARALAAADTDQHPAAPARHRTAPTVHTAPPRSSHGPATVQPRSVVERADGLGPGTGTGRASASRSSPARAAPPPDPRLEALRRELDGIDVSWQMTPEQAQAAAALVDVHGPRRLAEVALELVTARGRPTFARAWLGAWRQLSTGGAQAAAHAVQVQVPPPARWCGSCDSDGFRFEVDDDGRPIQPCPRCHPTSRQPAPF
jgi:hypothetical protein